MCVCVCVQCFFPKRIRTTHTARTVRFSLLRRGVERYNNEANKKKKRENPNREEGAVDEPGPEVGVEHTGSVCFFFHSPSRSQGTNENSPVSAPPRAQQEPGTSDRPTSRQQ